MVAACGFTAECHNINNLFCLPLIAKITGYADDTSLLYSKASAEEVIEDFQYDQKILTLWFQNYLLHLNINKCKGIVYSFKDTEKGRNINFKLDNKVLEKVDSIKYLGINIDRKLTWRAHSLDLQSKLRKLNYLFFHLRKHMNTKYFYGPL